MTLNAVGVAHVHSIMCSNHLSVGGKGLVSHPVTMCDNLIVHVLESADVIISKSIV